MNLSFNRRSFLYILLLMIIFSCSKFSNLSNINTMPNTENKNPFFSTTDTTQIDISNTEWKKILSPELYAIAREASTESPMSGKYNDFDEIGEYYCAVCGNHLFRSTAKFSSSCGWPSFFEADKNGVKYRKDISHGMDRIEVLCKRCNSHLGHVFNDGPKPTGVRFCMNSISLHFEPTN